MCITRRCVFTWVHRDEESNSRDEIDLSPQKVESFLLVSDGILDALDLHRHHREHLHCDSVELVEASPGTRLSQSLVDVTDGLKTATQSVSLW